ncbi:MAG: thioesterase [Pedobacter sp.]|nr:thioesterase [Chitinophagaceae bacterium]
MITNPIKYQSFLLTKLPLAFFVGLKLVLLQEDQAAVSVRFKWLNKNPFRSMYFAVLAMAAELSTGILPVAYTYKTHPSVSMLVVKCEGEFYKKAIGNIVFTCVDGLTIVDAINQTITTKQGVTISSTAIGKNEQDEVVAKFVFVWSFKAKG